MDYTYETKGAQRVAINQLGPALSKRQWLHRAGLLST